jgi:hypothetical protein
MAHDEKSVGIIRADAVILTDSTTPPTHSGAIWISGAKLHIVSDGTTEYVSSS